MWPVEGLSFTISLGRLSSGSSCPLVFHPPRDGVLSPLLALLCGSLQIDGCCLSQPIDQDTCPHLDQGILSVEVQILLRLSSPHPSAQRPHVSFRPHPMSLCHISAPSLCSHAPVMGSSFPSEPACCCLQRLQLVGRFHLPPRGFSVKVLGPESGGSLCPVVRLVPKSFQVTSRPCHTVAMSQPVAFFSFGKCLLSSYPMLSLWCLQSRFCCLHWTPLRTPVLLSQTGSPLSSESHPTWLGGCQML